MILTVGGSWCALRVEPSVEKHKRDRAVDVVTIDEAQRSVGIQLVEGFLAHAVAALRKESRGNDFHLSIPG